MPGDVSFASAFYEVESSFTPGKDCSLQCKLHLWLSDKLREKLPSLTSSLTYARLRCRTLTSLTKCKLLKKKKKQTLTLIYIRFRSAHETFDIWTTAFALRVWEWEMARSKKKQSGTASTLRAVVLATLRKGEILNRKFAKKQVLLTVRYSVLHWAEWPRYIQCLYHVLFH